MGSRKIRVLVVDDSALVRKLLITGLGADPEIELVGAAADAYEARDMLVKHRPDVITLDVEMPRMDGVTFLGLYMDVLPTPTVMLSSLTAAGKEITLRALEAGAVDFVHKPGGADLGNDLPRLMAPLIEKIKAAAGAQVYRQPGGLGVSGDASSNPEHLGSHHVSEQMVIGVGASTGGVAALSRIIPFFPADTHGMVVVEHMPGDFTKSFAKRLDTLSQMAVREAENGDPVRCGQVLIAPGDNCHCEVVKTPEGGYRVALSEGEPVNYQRPSVDVLFASLAKSAKQSGVGVIMTGMGSDGAEGLLKMRHAGAHTIGQNEGSSVVYGMPRAASKLGAVCEEVDLMQIPARVLAATVD